MSSAVDFLARMGSEAGLRHASLDTLTATLAAESLDPAVRAALLAGDQVELERLLGATANICCAIQPGDDEDEDEDDEDDFDDDDDDDDDEDEDEDENDEDDAEDP
jgi:hypothetical protein